ncbi:MAG: cysteine synthase A, partial [Deltaproteobacteria bacterium]|nr:cysteine synthase A [Deltaproteobacteria bacterium]
AGFIPEVLDLKVIDEVFRVRTKEAFFTSQLLARTEGLVVGISSGAAAFAASRLALRNKYNDSLIVVLLPDSGERYLSTALFDPVLD